MECNIYAHHQIKTVFLYFYWVRMELNSILNVRFFFSNSFPGLETKFKLSFSQIEKPDLKKKKGHMCLHIDMYLQLESSTYPFFWKVRNETVILTLELGH